MAKTIINKISEIKHCELLEKYSKGEEVPKEIFLSHTKILSPSTAKYKNLWICSDNRTGDMRTEGFETIEEAHAWAKERRCSGK